MSSTQSNTVYAVRENSGNINEHHLEILPIALNGSQSQFKMLSKMLMFQIPEDERQAKGNKHDALIMALAYATILAESRYEWTDKLVWSGEGAPVNENIVPSGFGEVNSDDNVVVSLDHAAKNAFKALTGTLDTKAVIGSHTALTEIGGQLMIASFRRDRAQNFMMISKNFMDQLYIDLEMIEPWDPSQSLEEKKKVLARNAQIILDLGKEIPASFKCTAAVFYTELFQAHGGCQGLIFNGVAPHNIPFGFYISTRKVEWEEPMSSATCGTLIDYLLTHTPNADEKMYADTKELQQRHGLMFAVMTHPSN